MVTWIQPILTANDSDEALVVSSGGGAIDAYKAFDDSTTTRCDKMNVDAWLQFVTLDEIEITAINITSNGYLPASGIFQVSNDNGITWIDVGTWTDTSEGSTAANIVFNNGTVQGNFFRLLSKSRSIRRPNLAADIANVQITANVISIPLSFNFDTSRKVANVVNSELDTLRVLKTKWRYENFGIADLLSVNGTTVVLDDAKYKYAFYQTVRAKCFDIPVTNEIWCKFDLYHYSGKSRFRVFDDRNGSSANGFVLTQNSETQVALWSRDGSSNKERATFDNVLVPNTNQTWLLHMISGVTDGVLELWCDGNFVGSYTGNVNNGADFENFYLQSVDANNLFSNVIIANYQIGLNENVAIDFAADFDTRRKIIGTFQFAQDLDTQLNIIRSVNLSADTQLNVFRSIETNFDTFRQVIRSVNLFADTLRKKPYPFIVSPKYNLLPIDTPVTAGIQTLGINLVAGQLVDQFNFVTINKINMLEQIRGQYLDYKFNFRVERTSDRDVFTDLPITSCQCCSDIDRVLYTQIAYTLSKTTWTDGGIFKKDISDSTPTPWGGIRKKNKTETIKKPLASAGSHISAIAASLGKTPVLLFDDFISTVDTQQEGVTYQDLIGEIFSWSQRVPHKLINVFLRDDKLFVIERGHEQNIYSLDDLEITQIGKDVTIDKSLVRTSFGVTRETTDIEKWLGSTLEPILGDEITDEEPEEPEEPDEPDPEPEGISQNLPTHERFVENNVVTDIYYSYDNDGNLISTVTVTDSRDPLFMSRVEVLNSYSTAKNGEKLLKSESTNKYEVDNDTGQWKMVESKTIYHTYTTVGQQHSVSIDKEGEVEVSTTANARRDDRPTPFDSARNSQSALNNAINQDDNKNSLFFTYRDGKKYEITGFQSTSNIATGTLEEVKLYDSSFPVGKDKAQSITNDIKWLNRRIQEVVTLEVYDFPHVFDFNDKVIFRGNTYHLQSNSVAHFHNINKQSLQLIRWCNKDGTQGTDTTGAKWELVYSS